MYKAKNEILLSISDKDDKMLISSVYDKLEQSGLKNYSCYSDFLDARQLRLIEGFFGFLKDDLVFYGGILDAERKIATKRYEYSEVPIKIIKIKTPADITHRDVLGSLMSLGIKRQKIGDIIIDDFIYIAVKDEIKDYILENFTKIRNYNIEPILSDSDGIKREQEYIEIPVTVPSLRIDAVIASMINLSREKSKELILSGRVNLNHFEILDNRKTLNLNDIISIKGVGRFKLSQINGTTKKDRIRIVILKYK